MISAHNTNSLFSLFFLEFKFVLNKTDVRWQINAAHLFCDTVWSVNQQWWSLLLNQDVDWLQMQMFVQMNNVDADKHKKVWNTVSSLLSWNNKQKNILHNDDKFHSGACLFEDFSDIKKTKVLAALTLIYLLCSFHVILMTSMRMASDNEAQNIVKFIKHSSNIKQFESIWVYCLLMKIHKLHEQPVAAEDVMMIIKLNMHLLELLMKMKKDLGQHSYNLINMFLHAKIIK